ncbi:hypothetical protein CIK89_09290 [Prevotella sp. P4-119]|nr:hypothetical protein CIK89_09290 [Prevotella sp. P4-119]
MEQLESRGITKQSLYFFALVLRIRSHTEIRNHRNFIIHGTHGGHGEKFLLKIIFYVACRQEILCGNLYVKSKDLNGPEINHRILDGI